MQTEPKKIIPTEVMLGKKKWLNRLIKSNKNLYRLIFKIRNCSRLVYVLKKFWKDVDSPFKYIVIETYPICNRVCSFCPLSEDKAKKEPMSDELFGKILNELKGMKFCGDICLTSYGEPLLDKRLADFVRKLKKNLAVKVSFFTNGDFLTPERFRELVSAGIDSILLSQHDPEPSQAIKNLFAGISPEEWKYLSLEEVNENSTMLSNRGGSVKVKSLHPLYCAPEQIIVRADGNVPLCCNDYYKEVNFGNVRQKKLIDIWDSPFYKKVRNNIKRGNFNLNICKKCRGVSPSEPKL